MRYTHRRRTYTSSTTPRHSVSYGIRTKGGYVRSTSTVGGETESETGYSGFSVSPPHVAITSTPGLVVLFASLLYVTVTWNGFFKEYWNGLISAKTPQPQMDYHIVMGGIVFIVILGVGAAASPDLAGVEMLMLLALWLLYIMFQGQGLTNILNWFNKGTTTQSSGSSQPNAGPGAHSITVAQTGKLPAGGPH